MAENNNRRPYPPVNFAGENWLPYTRLIPAFEIG
ncbi:TPA: putative metallopeptidase, partial [Klebsiella pneumoniae]